MDASLRPWPTRLLKPWLIVSTFGLPLILAVAFFIASFGFGGIGFVVLFWILIGSLQTLVLGWVDTTGEERLLKSWWLASVVGSLIAGILLLLMPMIGANDNDYRTGVLLWSCMAMAVGSAQWFVLRQYVAHAWLWIVVMTLAALLTSLGLSLAVTFGVLSIFIVSGTTGLLTGISLDWLLRPIIPVRF